VSVRGITVNSLIHRTVTQIKFFKKIMTDASNKCSLENSI